MVSHVLLTIVKSITFDQSKGSPAVHNAFLKGNQYGVLSVDGRRFAT